MRIISGKFRGRKFFPPAKNWPTRPTTDFNKEALYNILQNQVDFADIRFLDLFGGTGNHCFECISRGCTQTTYVDKFRGCVNFVRKLAKELDIEKHIRIVQGDVFRFCIKDQNTYDYIFAGPPYPLQTTNEIPDLIFQQELLAPRGIFILEHNMHFAFDNHPNLDQVRQYGQSYFSFFRNLEDL
jgi:16S rRNA (guanine(966)-N(2))-methyltransferase RsmD